MKFANQPKTNAGSGTQSLKLPRGGRLNSE